MYSVTRRSVSFMTSMAMLHLRKALVRAQMVTQVAIPVEQAVLSATAVPARAIGRQDEIGAIADGMHADFVVCGEDLTRQAVYLGGSLL